MKIKDAVVIDRDLLLNIVSVLYGTDIKIEYQELEPIIKDAYNAGYDWDKDIEGYLNDTEI
jgi:hypothetical protein